MSKSLRETVLEQQLRQLQRQFDLMHRIHMATLTTIVYYLGGELTITIKDFDAAKGLLLTETMDPTMQSRTFRTRRIGHDGGEIERGGLLPPNAGSHNGVDYDT